jgi:3-dehydroquinate synthase
VDEQRIRVDLGKRSYDIVLQNGLIGQNGADIIAGETQTKRVVLVTHPHLSKRYAEPLADGLNGKGIETTIVLVAAGERSKNLAAVGRLYAAFLDARLDRKSLVVAVGGGVLGDLVGFAAATYLRGIRFVQVPTTLLAQVDSSIGGKTGVDLPQGKNLVGAFHQPSVVLIDPRTLRTLPARELRSGFAEVIKYGIIYDAEFFAFLRHNLPELRTGTSLAVQHAIARSCEIKADVVSQDETEQGLRAILNFGHTIGHALETLTQYRRYKHGEAIAIGMLTECLIGEEMGITPPEVTQTLQETFAAFGLPTEFPADIDADAVLRASQKDKKTVGGRLFFVLPERIGTVAVWGVDGDKPVREAIRRHQG